MQLLYFNPENDLALAADAKSLTLSRQVSALKNAGCFLPVWLNEPDCAIFCDEIDAMWSERIARDFGLCPKLFGKGENVDVENVLPWGWSKTLVDELLGAGCPQAILPSSEWLENVRNLSHRITSLMINEALSERGLEIPKGVEEIRSLTEACTLASERPYIFKTPWSSSGRGITDTSTVDKKVLVNIVNRSLRLYRSIIAEPKLDKVQDFAMLFNVRNGKTLFMGFSLFDTLSTNVYSGNVLAKQSEIERAISETGIQHAALNMIKENLTAVLDELIAPHYEGRLGVDMMVYRCGDRIKVAPCIELNLRTTMGHIALSLSENFLDYDSFGRFEIHQSPSVGNGEYRTTNGRLVNGTVNLVPPNPWFSFVMKVKSRRTASIR